MQAVQGRYRVADIHIVVAALEVAAGDQHLPGAQAVAGERAGIERHQRRLPDGGSSLQQRHRPRPVCLFGESDAGPDRPAGHQRRMDALLVQRRELAGDAADDARVQLPVAAGQHGRADLHHQAANTAHQFLT